MGKLLSKRKRSTFGLRIGTSAAMAATGGGAQELEQMEEAQQVVVLQVP
jgi:hypothetical protein